MTDPQQSALRLAREALSHATAFDSKRVRDHIGDTLAAIDLALSTPTQAAAPAPDAGVRPVRFVGVDPLALTRGAYKPMIPDSWRFGFYEQNGALCFGHRDEGELVAHEAAAPPQPAQEVEAWAAHVMEMADRYARQAAEDGRTSNVLRERVRAALTSAPRPAEKAVEEACLKRALGHPMVLEIMADCADVIDAESDAQSDPDAGFIHDSGPWRNAARSLRERAAAIRADDPEIWPALASAPQAEPHCHWKDCPHGAECVHAPQAPQGEAVAEVCCECGASSAAEAETKCLGQHASSEDDCHGCSLWQGAPSATAQPTGTQAQAEQAGEREASEDTKRLDELESCKGSFSVVWSAHLGCWLTPGRFEHSTVRDALDTILEAYRNSHAAIRTALATPTTASEGDGR